MLSFSVGSLFGTDSPQNLSLPLGVSILILLVPVVILRMRLPFIYSSIAMTLNFSSIFFSLTLTGPLPFSIPGTQVVGSKKDLTFTKKDQNYIISLIALTLWAVWNFINHIIFGNRQTKVLNFWLKAIAMHTKMTRLSEDKDPSTLIDNLDSPYGHSEDECRWCL